MALFCKKRSRQGLDLSRPMCSAAASLLPNRPRIAVLRRQPELFDRRCAIARQ